MAQSVTSLKKQLSRQPKNTALLGALADTYRSQGKIPLAIDTYSHLLQIEPYNYQALNNFGALQRITGDIDNSLKTLLKANEILPNSPIILTNLSNTFLSMGRSDLAVEYSQHAVKLQPDFFDSNEMLGNACIAAGKFDEAIDSYNKALQIQPGNKSVITSLALANHRLGDNERAYEILKPILKPPIPECAAVFFNISKKIGLQKEAVDYLHKTIKPKNNADAPGYASLYFCLGKYYNETGLYVKAISAYHQANRLCNRQFDINETRKQFSEIIAAFPDSHTANDQIASNRSNKPIFVLGMPRSGTSLVEQILASHPEVYGAGELNNIDISAKEAKEINGDKFPMSIANLKTEELDVLTNKYLSYINNLSNEESKVSDKMPHNFMHIGFILRLFPSAHIIHCTRHPLDTTLSCYIAEFGNIGHNYAYNLNNMGKYYLEYNRLMDHWLSIYGDRIHDICYENLITDTEATCKNLLASCNLEWDEKCLDFHKTKRNVRTLSYDQVKRPIYSEAMFRWKHYKPFLGKLIETLSDVSLKHEKKLKINLNK